MWSCRQELESQLGVILFERSSQRVELTEPVRVFIEHAKLAVFHLERVVHLTLVSAKGAEVVVNFGSSPYIDPYIVSTVLSVRLPLFPTMRVHAHSYFSQELTHQASRLGLRAAMHDHKPRRCEREQVEAYRILILVLQTLAPHAAQKSAQFIDSRRYDRSTHLSGWRSDN